MKTVDETIEFIKEAHRDQVDKAGAPYYLHPISVMNRLPNKAAHETKLAALLHDVIEDTDWTAQQLLDEGFSDEVVEIVALVSKDPTGKQSYLSWIQSIVASGNIAAMMVKLADNEDNSDSKRLAQLLEAKRGILKRYIASMKLLRAGIDKITTPVQ